MKLLANAHVSRLMVAFLQGEGHDCLHAEAIKPGMTDEEILQVALQEQRVILTADKDFGELVFRHGVRASGIILLRLRAASETERFGLFRRHWPTVERHALGFFVVVTNGRIRRTPLPSD